MMGGMVVEGYMIEATWDGATLRVHAKNRAAAVALSGENHREDVIVTAGHIASVAFKDASMMVNGHLVVTTVAGQSYKLHFRRKQQAGMAELAGMLQSIQA